MPRHFCEKEIKSIETPESLAFMSDLWFFYYRMYPGMPVIFIKLTLMTWRKFENGLIYSGHLISGSLICVEKKEMDVKIKYTRRTHIV